jgi:hypothetical protein
MSLSITLDKYNFTLLGKDIKGRFNGKRHTIFLSISGNNIEPPIEFYIYRSNSDFGFWRLCMEEGVNSHLWKGDDYIQRTLIDFRLQEFINTKYDIIPLISDEKYGYGCYNMDNRFNDDDKPKAGRVIEEITKLHKPIELEPFNTFDKTHKCGFYEKTTENDLLIVKNEIDKWYTIYDGNVPIYLGYNFSTNLDSGIGSTSSTICTIEGNIYRKLLKSKTGGSSLWLYYIHIINFNVDVGPFLKEPIKINNLCIPVALTLEQSQISALGTYSYIVPAGKFICKIIDYTGQCDGERCSVNYNYIGDKYNSIQSMFKPPIDKTKNSDSEVKSESTENNLKKGGYNNKINWENKYLKYKTKYLKLKTSLF